MTICVQDNECLFGAIENGDMVLNKFGWSVAEEWLKTAVIRPGIELGSYVVMPNHFHGIVVLADDGTPSPRVANSKSIATLAASIHSINQQAVREYTPLVEGILRSRSQDKCHIEHTLDGLLDFCGHEPALQLYHRLCRHYWDIDPAATASYVEAYRTTWDSEGKEV